MSSDFSGANNVYRSGPNGDPFVAKVSDTGTILWSTYLGAGSDAGYGISLDASGNAFVTGLTGSTSFPGANNTYKGGTWDAFVAKVSSAGTLEWATYLGGSGMDRGQSISIDSSGNAILTGYTDSTNFTGVNNAFHGGLDAFVAKLSSAGTLEWATYLGGSLADYGYGISMDAAGNAFVAGWTSSADFSGANNSFKGVYDAVVAKVTSVGTLLWATYLGGSINDTGYGICVDASGNAFVTGYTYSTDFSGANNAFSGGSYDAFVAKILPTARTWDGGGTDDNWTTAANWVGDAAPLSGDSLAFPAGAARLDNINDYPPGTVFYAITVSGGNYHFLNNAIKSTTVEVQGNAVLTATSIVCDTLIIGSTAATAAVAANTAAPRTGNLPQSVAGNFPASEPVGKSLITSAAIDSATFVEQPIATKADAATVLGTSMVSIAPEAAPIIPSAMPVVSQTNSTAKTIPTVRLPEQTERRNRELLLAHPLLQEYFTWATSADLYVAARFDAHSLKSFSDPSLTSDRHEYPLYDEMTDSVAKAKRRPLAAIAKDQNARDFAMQSILTGMQYHFETRREAHEPFAGKHSRERGPLAEAAIDEFYVNLVACD
jgi:hypothetical protein